MLLLQDSRFETASRLIVRPLSINDFWLNVFHSFLKYIFGLGWRPNFGAQLVHDTLQMRSCDADRVFAIEPSRVDAGASR
jgi:hypothetical protein